VGGGEEKGVGAWKEGFRFLVGCLFEGNAEPCSNGKRSGVCVLGPFLMITAP
jgi:hypothetical protein